MPRRLPSSALDSQTQLTAAGTGAVLAGTWYIGTGGAGSGGAVAGTLNGPLTGTADSAKVLTPGKALNGTTFTGSADITVPVNTTSIATSGTYYPLFVPSSTAGNQQASTSVASGFTFDPNTKNLVVAGTVTGSNLSGTNTGDQTLPTLASLGAAPTASPILTGTVSSQHISMNRDPEDSYRLSQRSRFADWEYWNNATTLKWDYYRTQMAGEITLTRQFIRTGMSLNTTGDLTVAGKYYGDGSQLTNLPIPVTSVNGQTGAVTISAGVTTVNGSTGDVKVGSIYDSVGSVAPGSKYILAPSIIHNPVLFQLSGGYVGDYFSSTGFSFTGVTVTGFQSQLIGGSAAEECWQVTFGLTFSQAFFDTHAPGYGPDDMRMVNVTMNPQGLNYFTQYGVRWTGFPKYANWTTNRNTNSTVSYVTDPGPTGVMVYKAYFVLSTDVGDATQFVFVNNRYSPASWPAYLYLNFWVAK